MSSSPHILIVDDNQDSSDMLRFMLERSGDSSCQITSAPTAEEALSLVAEQNFDLYILDYHLPEMSGVELCRHLRQNDSETPIMFFSAMAHRMNVEKGIQAGANEYLVKPNDLIRITETVENLLKLKKPESF